MVTEDSLKSLQDRIECFQYRERAAQCCGSTNRADDRHGGKPTKSGYDTLKEGVKMNMNPHAESGNSPPEKKSLITFSQVRESDIAAMSFRELDGLVDAGINQLVLNLVNIRAIRKALTPAIRRVHDALCCQGRRTDLLDAGDITWTEWMESKNRLGSKATFARVIADAGLKPLQLTEGETVRDKGTLEIGEVVELPDFNGEPKATVKFGKGEVVTVPTTDLMKIKSSVRNVKVGDLFLLLDKGAEYVYNGDGKFARTETPTLAQQKKMKEEADARKKKDAEARKKEKAAAGKAKTAAASHATPDSIRTYCGKDITPETNLATGRITCKKCHKKGKQAKSKVAKNAGESMGTPAAPPQAGEFDPPSPLHTSAPKSKRNKPVEPWKPFFARPLGDKFAVFKGDEVEFTANTARGSYWDTMPEAEAHAGRLNAKYAPKAEGASA
jgi:hypothetical protein